MHRRKAGARNHGAAFCGVYPEFPCEGIGRMMPWNPDIIRRMETLTKEYSQMRKENPLC